MKLPISISCPHLGRDPRSIFAFLPSPSVVPQRHFLAPVWLWDTTIYWCLLSYWRWYNSAGQYRGWGTSKVRPVRGRLRAQSIPSLSQRRNPGQTGQQVRGVIICRNIFRTGRLDFNKKIILSSFFYSTRKAVNAFNFLKMFRLIFLPSAFPHHPWIEWYLLPTFTIYNSPLILMPWIKHGDPKFIFRV